MGRLSFNEVASPCERCARRGDCDAPCEKLEGLLPDPCEGREPDKINAKRAALADALADAWDALPPRLAAVCALYYRCGKTDADIGLALGCSRRNAADLRATAARRCARIAAKSGNGRRATRNRNHTTRKG